MSERLAEGVSGDCLEEVELFSPVTVLFKNNWAVQVVRDTEDQLADGVV
jgi:hypothetical protein